MPIVLDNFKSKFGAGARPNQFRVELVFPSYVDFNSDYSILVTGAAIPPENINPMVVLYRGREVKFAGERLFDPLTLTVLNDDNFTIRDALSEWMNGINNRENNTGLTKPEDYQVDMRIVHTDRNGDDLPHGTFTLRDAWPINMSEIGLQYAQSDVGEEYTVTFQYNSFDIE